MKGAEQNKELLKRSSIFNNNLPSSNENTEECPLIATIDKKLSSKNGKAQINTKSFPLQKKDSALTQPSIPIDNQQVDSSDRRKEVSISFEKKVIISSNNVAHETKKQSSKSLDIESTLSQPKSINRKLLQESDSKSSEDEKKSESPLKKKVIISSNNVAHKTNKQLSKSWDADSTLPQPKSIKHKLLQELDSESSEEEDNVKSSLTKEEKPTVAVEHNENDFSKDDPPNVESSYVESSDVQSSNEESSEIKPSEDEVDAELCLRKKGKTSDIVASDTEKNHGENRNITSSTCICKQLPNVTEDDLNKVTEFLQFLKYCRFLQNECVELAEESNIWVDKVKLHGILEVYQKKPKEMARQLMKLVIPTETLQKMTPTGKCVGENDRMRIPENILMGVYNCMTKNIRRSKHKLDFKSYRQVMTSMCATLRNPRNAGNKENPEEAEKRKNPHQSKKSKSRKKDKTC
ncbi:hypothetical protein TKK_0013908 [Trichogramma kaykai]